MQNPQSSSNLKTQRLDRMPKIVESRDLGNAHFQGKLFVCLLGIHHIKPCTKFEVCSSSSFGDMFKRMPKIVGVTWPRPRPLTGKIIIALARHSRCKAAYQIWSL